MKQLFVSFKHNRTLHFEHNILFWPVQPTFRHRPFTVETGQWSNLSNRTLIGGSGVGAALGDARGLSSLVTDYNDGRPRCTGGEGGQDLSNDSARLIRNVNKDIIFFFETLSWEQ